MINGIFPFVEKENDIVHIISLFIYSNHVRFPSMLGFMLSQNKKENNIRFAYREVVELADVLGYLDHMPEVKQNRKVTLIF